MEKYQSVLLVGKITIVAARTYNVAFALIEGPDCVVQFLNGDRHSAPESGDVAFLKANNFQWSGPLLGGVCDMRFGNQSMLRVILCRPVAGKAQASRGASEEH